MKRLHVHVSVDNLDKSINSIPACLALSRPW